MLLIPLNNTDPKISINFQGISLVPSATSQWAGFQQRLID